MRLSEREYGLLSKLCDADGAPVSREGLRDAVGLEHDWRVDFAIRNRGSEDRAGSGHSRIVLTVHGLGYRLAVDPPAPPPTARRERLEVGERPSILTLGAIEHQGRRVALTTLQRGVLNALLEADGAVVAAGDAGARAVGRRSDGRALRAVDAVVCQLRALLEEDPRGRPIWSPPAAKATDSPGRRPIPTWSRRAARRWSGGIGCWTRFCAALGSERAVVLTGPGGVGKSRLALEVCLRLAGELAGGGWWVDAAPVATAQGLARSILDVWGWPSARRRPPGWVAARLGRRPGLLLLLDNVEHLAGVDLLMSELLALIRA